MADVDYRAILSEAATGVAVGEIPLTLGGGIPFKLNGYGEVEATCPKNLKVVSDAVLNTLCEVTYLRDDVPFWNSVVTYVTGSLRQDLLTLRLSEPSWYFWARVLEHDYATTDDVFTIARYLLNDATTKTANGTDGMTFGANINAAIARFSIDPASALAGVSQTVAYVGTDFRFIGDLLQDLAQDADAGFDWRMDYTTGSDRQTANRTFVMGSPNLGTLIDRKLNEHLLDDFNKTLDWSRSGTRSHMRGKGITSTKQNAAAVTAGQALLERVFNRTDLADSTRLSGANTDALHRSSPPVSQWQASFVPGDSLPIDLCKPGDHVQPYIPGYWTHADGSMHQTFLNSVGNRRVTLMEVYPPTASAPERVVLTTDVPLDSVGS